MNAKTEPPAHRKRLGELMVEQGLVDAEQLEFALERQQASGTRLGTQLLMLGLVSEETLASFLSEQLGIPFMHHLSEVDTDAVQQLPASVALQYSLLPVRTSGEGLMVAMADPSDERALEAVARAVGTRVFPMVAPELVVSYGIRRFYNLDTEDITTLPQVSRPPQYERSSVEVDALFA